MGGMAFGASANGNGPVHEFLLEGGAVVTFDTEVCLILVHVQQESA